MNIEKIKTKKEQYIAMGRAALDAAQEMLRAHADEWTSDLETQWRDCVHRAALYLAKATAIDEVLSE